MICWISRVKDMEMNQVSNHRYHYSVLNVHSAIFCMGFILNYLEMVASTPYYCVLLVEGRSINSGNSD